MLVVVRHGEKVPWRSMLIKIVVLDDKDLTWDSE